MGQNRSAPAMVTWSSPVGQVDDVQQVGQVGCPSRLPIAALAFFCGVFLGPSLIAASKRVAAEVERR